MAPVKWFCFDPGAEDSERVFIHMRSVVQRTWDVLDVISQPRAWCMGSLVNDTNQIFVWICVLDLVNAKEPY